MSHAPVGLLSELRAIVARYDDPSGRYDHPRHDPPSSVGAIDVRAYLRSRRLRDRFFEPDLFADPAWDILLDLWLARAVERDVSVSSLCIASAVPPTTALRWIDRLEGRGYLVREQDPTDARRRHIDLSQHAIDSLRRYFDALSPAGLPSMSAPV